eukprot:TRINITY_DN637_c0_g1_i1.p1 TRINITY_DN637_c0_g1~~TRINITY_DN637_c0_g1_i1.p1  ORF type:complete len:260 (-),score=60.21 TRINITY_DN637_c0_g1_i1:299-1078(-)
MCKLLAVVVLALAASNVYCDKMVYAVAPTKKVEKPKPSPKPLTLKIIPDEKPSPKPVMTKKDKEDKEEPAPVTITLVDAPVTAEASAEAVATVTVETPEAVDAPVEEAPETEGCITVAEAAVGTPELSTLVAALTAAGLVDVFADPEFVGTVLAPTDEAFDALIEAFNATPEQVLADPQLANILKYHVIPDAAVLSSDLEDGATVPTLLGQDLTVDLSDGVTFVGAGSSANVIAPDFEACKAVIHVIDTVLLPDFAAIN